MKKLKVAFCFSGQIRTWRQCYPMWKKLADNFEIEPDIFIHTWDHNTEQQRIASWSGGITDHMLVDNIDEYISTLKPKLYKIDTHLKSMECIKTTENEIRKYVPSIDAPMTVGWMGPQFYSMMYSAFLKQQYELENGVEYDLVFKFRNDLLLTDYEINRIINSKIIPDVPDDSVLYTVHSGASDIPKAGFARVGDIFFAATSITYDMVCNFYRMIPYIFTNAFDTNIYPPEFYLAYYIKSLQLSFVDMSLDIKIARTNDYIKNLKDKNLLPLNCDIMVDEIENYQIENHVKRII